MALAQEGKKSLAAAPVTMTGIGFHELLGCFQYLIVSRSCSSEGLDCIRQQLSDAATELSAQFVFIGKQVLYLLRAKAGMFFRPVFVPNRTVLCGLAF